MKGVIAFDIDGTLTHRLDWIDPQVVDWLQGLGERGWQVALITGRMYSFAQRIVKNLSFPYILGVQNGADLLNMPGRDQIKRCYLNSSILPLIERAYDEAAEDFILYAGIDEGDFCYYRPQRFSKKMLPYLEKLEGLGAKKWRPSDFHFEKETEFSLIKCFGKEKIIQRVHDHLRENGRVEVSMIRDPIDPSLYLALITHPEANKGSSATYLREHLHAPFLIAAGDDRNDSKMLQAADIGIAMAGAPKELLEIADIHAGAASDKGIIDAVEEAMTHAGA